ncbi:hypothetical protein [Streptomyces sp. NPDC058572]|uniref:hypothetical protein n=1 Tax=Streptomyces sp. NPDC058572 TaxID=3346546 RepID=UPI00364D5EB0
MSAQSESAQVTPPTLNNNPAVLRFPQIILTQWYRVAELAYGRGLLPARKFRLAQFLSRQSLDPLTGRVVGRWGTGQVDGGLALAERYAYVHGIGEDRFWDDLKGLYHYGLAEQVVKPAPGRRAVYALCLRADAIPGDLPDDLMRELKVWDLPDAEDPYEDAEYGRLTTREAVAVEPLVVECGPHESRQLADAPRWEHPAHSKAAQVAGKIRESARWLGAADTPNLHCAAVAEPDRAAVMSARVHRLMVLMGNGKASPLYAKGFSQLVGFSSTGSSDLSPARIEQPKTTPSAAPGRRGGQVFGEDFSAVARRVQSRVWHSWRAQLGRSEVLLPSMTPQERRRSVTGDPWSDLHHTIVIALRRSTESELVDLLTDNVIRHDQWGHETFRADNLGRLAAWRLWRLIRERDAAGYGQLDARRRKVPQAAHVSEWDDIDTALARRERILSGQTNQQTLEAQARLTDARRAEARRRDEAMARAEAERREKFERWNLGRWAREPENVHEEEQAGQRHVQPPPSPTKDGVHAAALAKARAEKRARRHGI